jgi:hypothetical protein
MKFNRGQASFTQWSRLIFLDGIVYSVRNARIGLDQGDYILVATSMSVRDLIV